jgi:hypothetical protein
MTSPLNAADDELTMKCDMGVESLLQGRLRSTVVNAASAAIPKLGGHIRDIGGAITPRRDG